MKRETATLPAEDELQTEFLILPNGTILVQNLTRPMAKILLELNPQDETIKRRVTQ